MPHHYLLSNIMWLYFSPHYLLYTTPVPLSFIPPFLFLPNESIFVEVVGIRFIRTSVYGLDHSANICREHSRERGPVHQLKGAWSLRKETTGMKTKEGYRQRHSPLKTFFLRNCTPWTLPYPSGCHGSGRRGMAGACFEPIIETTNIRLLVR